MRRYEITDKNWQRLAPLLPGKAGDVGYTAADNQLVINVVLWIARSWPWLRATKKPQFAMGGLST